MQTPKNNTELFIKYRTPTQFKLKMSESFEFEFCSIVLKNELFLLEYV